MSKHIVSYETAEQLKEFGFNEKCTHYYVREFQFFKAILSPKQFSTPVEDNVNILALRNLGKGQPHLALAPTQSLAQTWLRKTYNIHIVIENNASGYYFALNKAEGGSNIMWAEIGSGPNEGGVWDTYEEVLEKAIQESFKYIK